MSVGATSHIRPAREKNQVPILGRARWRQAEGGIPTIFLKARLKAASEPYPV
jgi:hypothetical protein